MYNFDRELRLLVFDVIERIEIAQICNICAHHGRLWNKNLPGRPNLMARPPRPWLTSVPPANEHHMLYIHLCCMQYLLDVVSPGHHFKDKLTELLRKNLFLCSLNLYAWKK